MSEEFHENVLFLLKSGLFVLQLIGCRILGAFLIPLGINGRPSSHQPRLPKRFASPTKRIAFKPRSLGSALRYFKNSHFAARDLYRIHNARNHSKNSLRNKNFVVHIWNSDGTKHGEFGKKARNSHGSRTQWSQME